MKKTMISRNYAAQAHKIPAFEAEAERIKIPVELDRHPVLGLVLNSVFFVLLPIFDSSDTGLGQLQQTSAVTSRPMLPLIRSSKSIWQELNKLDELRSLVLQSLKEKESSLVKLLDGSSDSLYTRGRGH